MSAAKKLLNVACALSLLGVVVLVAGCGVDQSPMASDEVALTQTENGRTFLTFSPYATRRAAKIASIPEDGVTVTDMFDDHGGKLEVKDKNDKGKTDDMKIRFDVDSGALTSPVEITMTVYGNALEELVIAFQPGGLVFLEEAELAVNLGSDLVHTSLEDIHVWHEDEDGEVEEAYLISAEEKEKELKLKISIPGFSTYGMRDR